MIALARMTLRFVLLASLLGACGNTFEDARSERGQKDVVADAVADAD